MSHESIAAAPIPGPAPLPPGYIQLYDSFRPGLGPGTYQLAATQAVGGVDTGTYFGARTQSFTVDAPRFALDPGDLGEVYPPADSSGAFAGTLPSIVLNRRSLPWERALTADPSVPWVALLTFGPGEIVPDPDTGLPLSTGSVAGFLSTADPAVLPPAIDQSTLTPQQSAGTVVSVVVPRAVFTAVAPAPAEAQLLSHVRHTDTAAQAASDAARDGWYAVVVGNRFPATGAASDGTGTANLACLVSLEGLAGYLPGGGAPAGPPGQSLRLAVLASWSFTCNPAGTGSFAQLLSSLLPSAADADQVLVRIPTPAGAAPSTALTRLAEGYAPLGYGLATGEQTFAWYRGPLTPYPALALPAPANGTPHYANSAEVTIYAQADGVFDASYAVAFEAGRLAALADRGFAVSLVNARRGAYQALGTVRDRIGSRLFAAVPAAPAKAGDADGTDGTSGASGSGGNADATAAHPAVSRLAGPRLASQTFGHLLNSGLGDSLTAALTDAPQSLGVTPLAASRVSAAPPAPPTPPVPPAPKPPRPAPPDPVAQMRALLARADVQDLLAALVSGAPMDPVTDWLARLALLHQVPFRHLVPDERMLAVESVRFFYLDTGWIAALIDGALSIGVEGGRDLELQAAMSNALVDTVARKVGAVRAAQRARPDLAVPTGGHTAAGTGASAAIAMSAGTASQTTRVDDTPAPAPGLRAGLLLRSAVVAGWPGLTVQADGGATALLRLDRLSDSVLLAVFDGVPATVTLGEPWHGLRFGLGDNAALQLRNPDGTSLGAAFPAAGQPALTTAYTRPPAPQSSGGLVLQVGALAAALLGTLRQLIPGQGGATLTMGPALFATELIVGAHQLTFLPIPPPALPQEPTL